MANGFALSMRFLPVPVDLRPELNNATPSLQPHYGAFTATTGCSAPVPRFGTLTLVGATYLDFSLRIGATGSHVPRKSLTQSHAAFISYAVFCLKKKILSLILSPLLSPSVVILHTR